jgi:hyperosmotically inducible protein
MRTLLIVCMVFAAIAGCNRSDSAARVPGDRPPSMNNAAAPDNTAVNKRDAEVNTKTPLDQKENQADLDLTAKIRQRVLDVKDLSVNARNAKIISADGKVTLRGPVNSTQERDTLGQIARDVAGEGNVDNQLEVAAAGVAPRSSTTR